MIPNERVPAKERRSHKLQRQYLETKLKNYVPFAYENAQGMRRWFEMAGVHPSEISSIDNLKKLPIFRKDYLVNLQKAEPPFGGLVTVSPENLKRICVSPGPIFDPCPRVSPPWSINLIKRLGFREGDIVVLTQSYHLVPAGTNMDDWLTSAGCCVIPWGPGNTDLLIDVIHRIKVTGIVGSASYVMDIINRAEAKGYDIQKDFHLRIAMAGMEMGGRIIRRTLEEKYGIATCPDIYGTPFAGVVAMECSERNGMHISPEMIVEIVDPQTGKDVMLGEAGEIVVTPFDEVCPLVRVGTGYLSRFNYEPCSCGRKTPRLTRILGRSGDAVRARGVFIHPLELGAVVSTFQEISKYQTLITRPDVKDVITLKVELASEEGVNKDELADKLKLEFSRAVRCHLDRVEFVPTGTIPQEHKLIVDARGEWT